MVHYLCASIIIILILFFVKFAISDHVLDPPSGKIEVTEGGTYEIGIDDYGEYDLKSCSFYSDTGCNATFPIGPTLKAPSEYLCYTGTYLYANIVQGRGKQDLCKIVVSSVDEYGPKVWNLIAYDEETDTNINETFYITFVYKAKILHEDIRIMDGESLFNHLILEDKKLISCTLNYKDTEINLDLKSEKSSITHFSSNNDINRDTASKFQSLGRNLCGYKLTNVSYILDQNVRSILTAVDDQGVSYRASSVTNVNSKIDPGNLHWIQPITFGDAFSIKCGAIVDRFCLIFNPDGELVSDQKCIYEIERSTVNHLGKWKCYKGLDVKMESLEYTIDVVKRDRGTIETWQLETTEYLSIGCKQGAAVPKLDYCKMIAPGGQIINVLDFVASERFSSIGTNFQERICSLQIKKPLKITEIGLWKCEFKQQQNNPTGAFIHVNSMAIPDYPKEIKLTTSLDKEFNVSCQVPYHSDYCLIKSPNGTIYNIRKLLDLNMGRCQFYIDHVTKSDNGTWTCTYGRKTGLPDEEIKVEVSISELLRYSKRIEADAGDRVTFICSSGGIPLQYCRFISPNGFGYHIGNHQTSERIGYYGEGLEYGDCGISISNIQPSEAGEWKCITKLFNEIDAENYEKEIIGNIFLDLIVPPQSTTVNGINVGAIGIGTVVLIVVVGSVIAMVAIRKWKKKQNIENNIITENNEGQLILNN